MRQVVLSAQKGGVSRLRVKGGASPDTLYLLTNAYVTSARTIAQKPGLTRKVTLNSGTIGLVAFRNRFYVFASTFVGQSAPNVTCVVLRHPTNAAATLVRIHFAQPFLGRLYVTAEFSTGDVFDYWLQEPAVWTANTTYTFQQSVSPSVPNGFVYSAGPASTLPVWSANVEVALNAEFQPTVASGFKFKAIAISGSPARTGTAEPTWPTTEGGTVTEYRSG